ncbi:hypothetical protein NITUZ_40003 [Candidatus Nitrosotenuis uzonensis]|uniref:Uncharacterized protein n=1 Tax=Candidatus Nitrosotenuis uzonensis TaxID=1407055 RepID=V6AT61_9ARCH|nr:hypothetical protein NITUZ_40003 [Candidatus Nitrosotenuis uzonensis]
MELSHRDIEYSELILIIIDFMFDLNGMFNFFYEPSKISQCKYSTDLVKITHENSIRKRPFKR